MRKRNIIFSVVFMLVILVSIIHAEKIADTPKKEVITYKGISKKTKKAVIIEYKIDRSKVWSIEEYRIEGNYIKDIKDPFALYKNNIDIKKEVSNTIQIDLDNRRVIYARTIEKYDFGSIRKDFDIRNTVRVVDKEGELSVFNHLAMEQIARLYNITDMTSIKLEMKNNPNDSFRTVLYNNGVKNVLINKENIKAHEIEIKFEGMPMTFIFPKIYMYVEEDYPHRVLKFNNMIGMMDTYDFYLSGYSRY